MEITTNILLCCAFLPFFVFIFYISIHSFIVADIIRMTIVFTLSQFSFFSNIFHIRLWSVNSSIIFLAVSLSVCHLKHSKKVCSAVSLELQYRHFVWQSKYMQVCLEVIVTSQNLHQKEVRLSPFSLYPGFYVCDYPICPVCGSLIRRPNLLPLIE